MRTLITGGAGFIGSHLARRCAALGQRVRVIDNLRSGSIANLPKGIDFIESCITDEPLIRKLTREADIVFHLAAVVGVTESMEDPEATQRINVLGTDALVRACIGGKVRKLIFASTAAIYGPSPSCPQHEDLPPDPRSPYASSKLYGEVLLEHHRNHRRLDSASLRFFNVYGPRQNPNGPYASVIPALLARAMRNEPITVHGTGEQTRDFIHIDDIVSALLLTSAPAGPSGILNVGTGEQTSINTLIGHILTRTVSRSTITHVSPRSNDAPASRACIARLRKAGWEPEQGLEAGLDQLVREMAKEEMGLSR